MVAAHRAGNGWPGSIVRSHRRAASLPQNSGLHHQDAAAGQWQPLTHFVTAIGHLTRLARLWECSQPQCVRAEGCHGATCTLAPNNRSSQPVAKNSSLGMKRNRTDHSRTHHRFPIISGRYADGAQANGYADHDLLLNKAKDRVHSGRRRTRQWKVRRGLEFLWRKELLTIHTVQYKVETTPTTPA